MYSFSTTTQVSTPSPLTTVITSARSIIVVDIVSAVRPPGPES